MVTLLRRSNGLYWVEANSSGPAGKDNPELIKGGHSVSFLADNQAMRIISKRLFDITKNETYLNRVKKTSLVLSIVYNYDGVYLNDRDVWTNNAFMSDFTTEIVANPQFTDANADHLLSTATSIASKDVTDDGYYGGSWQGPTGSGCIWTARGSLPEQIM